MRGPFPSGVLKYARACNPNRCLDGAGDRVATAASLRATTYRANAGSERSFLTKTPASVKKRDRLPTGPDVSTATTRRHRRGAAGRPYGKPVLVPLDMKDCRVARVPAMFVAGFTHREPCFQVVLKSTEKKRLR